MRSEHPVPAATERENRPIAPSANVGVRAVNSRGLAREIRDGHSKQFRGRVPESQRDGRQARLEIVGKRTDDPTQARHAHDRLTFRFRGFRPCGAGPEMTGVHQPPVWKPHTDLVTVSLDAAWNSTSYP